MPGLPSGTVTFLLTDIEDSSMKWERDAVAMRDALAGHDTLTRQVIEANGGSVVKHMGDGCWAAFASAPQAATAAVEILRRLQTDPALGGVLRVRIGLHTGDVEPTGEDYFGPVPNRSARVTGLAHGDQIVCSAPTAALLEHLELRSEGMHELKGIGAEEVFTLHPPDVTIDPRPLRASTASNNLPRVQTSFVGRDQDLKRVGETLRERHAVVTLLGPGGVGKTRLAIEAGLAIADDEPTPIHFCDLTAVAEEADVADVVAEVVGARHQPGMDIVRSIVDYLAGRASVVVLDSCEHVIGAVRPLVEALAEGASVRVIATSREALAVRGEQIVVVGPLDADTAGVQLFIDRARERDRNYEAGEEAETAIRDIVARLDGIPLAIELAAARIRLLTPQEMSERLDDRFKLLGGGRPRGRHETLRATVSWSYQLLSDAEARLFDRLTVFAGGFTLDEVEEVCAGGPVEVGDVVDLLMALVDKSMVETRADGRQRRFFMLETLRRFGEEELASSGETEEFRGRHAAVFLDLARVRGAAVHGPLEHEAWLVLDREWANLRAALDTFEALDDRDAGADLIVSLFWFATYSMRYELFAWALELLDADGIEEHPSYVDLCGAAALGAYFTVHGDPVEWASRGLAADPDDPQGFCRTALAAVHLNNLHTAEASETLTSEWLATNPSTTGGRLWAEAFRVFHLCSHAPSSEAALHARAVREIADRTRSMSALGVEAWAHGQVVTFDDLDRAIEIWEEGLEWPRSAPGAHLVEHLVIGLLLHFRARRDPLPAVLVQCRQALAAALEAHYHVGSSHLFGVACIALCRAGDPETGAALIGAMVGNGHLPRPNALAALDQALGADVDDFVAEGMGLSVTDAGHRALAALDAATDRLGSQSA